MSKLANLKKKAADLEQRRLFDKALAVYEEVLQDQGGAEEADVGLYNRVGDLHLRQGNVEAALGRYEQAVDLYVERGFQNNAIALCNKILRQDPSRAEIHFRLGQISCSKGFRTEARRHFQEYVAQLNRAGSLERAITSLRDFADEHDELDDVRQMFADILVTHGQLGDAVTELARLREQYESDQRHADAEAVLGRIIELDPDYNAAHAPPHAASPEHGEGGATTSDAPVARPLHGHRAPAALDLVLFEPTDAPAPVHPASRNHAHPPAGQDSAFGGSSMGVAGASRPDAGVVDPAAGADASLRPLGLEPTSLESASLEPASPEPTALEPMSLEPTSVDAGLLELDARPPSGLELTGLELSGFDGSGPEVPGLEPSALDTSGLEASELEASELGVSGLEVSGFQDDAGAGDPGLLDLSPSAPPAEPVLLAAPWDAAGGVWEIPDPADDDELAGSALDVDVADGIGHPMAGGAPDDPSGAFDLLDDDDADGRSMAHGADEPLVFLTDDGHFDEVEPEQAAPAAGGFPRDGEAEGSGSVLVFLGDGISGEGDAPPADDGPEVIAAAPAPAQPISEPAPLLSAPAAPREPAASAPPAPLAAAPQEGPPASGDASFVNLGDWLREDDEPRSTRMVTEERAPTGDEDADFAEMLRKFKQGVADNVDDTDYASHYDLGIAFREMGLVEEAIAAFQRALRGTVQRVRAFEALGQCFIDKEQFAVAASVLQRALQEPGADDERLVGVLYLLGRAAEAQNQRTDALRYYQRVFAVDIEFGDVAERIGAVERVPL